MGRGRFLQLLSMPLSPCCPCHPAGANLALRSACAMPCCLRPDEGARPPDSFLSRLLVGSLSLRPCDSLTIPRMALSIDSTHFVSSMRAIQATGFLTFAPVGLMSPTEHASFIGRYSSAKIKSVVTPPPLPGYIHDATHRAPPFLPRCGRLVVRVFGLRSEL